MSEPDHFLARWSRRKRLAGEEQAAAEINATEASKSVPDQTPGARLAAAQAPQTGDAPKPDFDPASLPSLDSIGADTDISPFLKAGVPGELRHAALRRAWSADPAIRDFKGLQENDWNFNDPNGVPGFGELSPTINVKKMLGDLFGDSPRETGTAAEQPASAEQPVPPSQDLATKSEDEAPKPANRLTHDAAISSADDSTAARTDEILHRNIDIASQDMGPDTGGMPIKQRRRHGGALPQ
jgi:hypothetical protein